MPPSSRRSRSRGTVDQLPSGAYRVRVYAGSDPLTGKRHDLTEVVPPGPRAAAGGGVPAGARRPGMEPQTAEQVAEKIVELVESGEEQAVLVPEALLRH